MDDARAAAWEREYRGGGAPWDIGRPQPRFMAVASSMASPVLDCGCGTGENALGLAAAGLEVVGVDIASTAIVQAQRKAHARGLDATFVVGDVLALPALGRGFRTAIDSGCFHTFRSKADVATYVSGLRAVIEPGGTLYLMCFSDREPGTWGPRRITEAELRGAFAVGWLIDSIEPAEFETTLPSGGAHAWFAGITRVED